MLQRIQTIYLLVAACIHVFCAIQFIELYNITKDLQSFARNMYLIYIIFAVDQLFIIFLYKKRMLQIKFNRWLIVSSIIIWIYLLFKLFKSPYIQREFYILILLLPLVSVIFNVLSNRSIKKDDELVKSVDRIR